MGICWLLYVRYSPVVSEGVYTSPGWMADGCSGSSGCWERSVTSALLNIFRIRKVTGIRTRWFEWFIQPALLFAAAAALGQTFVRLAAPAGDVWQVACSVAATGGLFCGFLLPLGAGRQLKAVLDARRAPAKEN